MLVEISDDGFIHSLLTHNGGGTIAALDKAFVKGVGAILDNGGSAQVGISFKLRRDLETVMTLTPVFVEKFPKEAPYKQAMFISTGNGLVSHPQKQEAMPFDDTPIQKAPALGAPISRETNVTPISK